MVPHKQQRLGARWNGAEPESKGDGMSLAQVISIDRFLARWSQRPAPLSSTVPASEPLVVEVPTLREVEQPTTFEGLAAEKLGAHALASLIERRTGIPTTASEVLGDLRGIIGVWSRTYRDVARRRRNGARA